MNKFSTMAPRDSRGARRQSWWHIVALALTPLVVIAGFVALTVVVRRTRAAVRTSAVSFTAAHLGGEALELVRAVRDSNWRAGRSWDAGLDDGAYLVAYTLTTPAGFPLCRLGSPDCPVVRPLDQNPATGFYGYNGWGFVGRPAALTRIVTLRHRFDTGRRPYLSVTAEVSWGASSLERLTVAEHLYNWRTP